MTPNIEHQDKSDEQVNSKFKSKFACANVAIVVILLAVLAMAIYLLINLAIK